MDPVVETIASTILFPFAMLLLALVVAEAIDI